MSIKKLILGIATLASVALPGVASAQRYDGYGYGYGAPVRYDRYYGDRYDRYDRRDRWQERRRWREIQRRREWERRHRHDWRGYGHDRYYRY
jgi:hypothetical protein